LNLQDVFLLQTPGGGGYGYKDKQAEDEPDRKRPRLDTGKSTLTMVGTGSVFDYKRSQETV
jgi:N-methylhydantoinase B/oxoprolinase/acetone carboxylase alpha subunit